MPRYLHDPELYDLVNHLRSELSEQNEEMRALQAKNEQLQAEVDLMRRMDEPTLVALQQKDTEIERLRGLLRDVDDGLDDYWITTKEGVAWVCARHEALGE